jgi:hypothetical protein
MRSLVDDALEIFQGSFGCRNGEEHFSRLLLDHGDIVQSDFVTGQNMICLRLPSATRQSIKFALTCPAYRSAEVIAVSDWSLIAFEYHDRHRHISTETFLPS